MINFSNAGLPPPDMESVFAYLDFLEEGYSPDEIDAHFLGPDIEEADASFEEEAERVRGFVENSLLLCKQDREDLFSRLENEDFTGPATRRITELSASLKELKKVTETFSEGLETADEHLEVADRTNERIIWQLQIFTDVLRNA